jgi:tellurite resistance protein TerC
MKGLLDRLIFLSLGLAFILIFIGVKLMLLFGYETFGSVVPKIETGVSLLVIAGILVVSIIASVIVSSKDPTAVAHAGRVTAKKRDKETSPTNG